MTYTAVTFAPVQSFIRGSRKLRDLYGSSLLLSHLARALYVDASQQLGEQAVISPAGVSISRGVPNTLIIQGDYSAAQARAALLGAWGQVLRSCRLWLEQNLNPADPQSFPTTPEGWTGDWDAAWGFPINRCPQRVWTAAPERACAASDPKTVCAPPYFGYAPAPRQPCGKR
ncbi:MAG: type III-B CRISPR-associated protein Cas10/Cmr2 [Cyanobacteriota bacterium]